MFDEIRFNTIERLPNYVFTQINTIKMEQRHARRDIIDFSMGNPDGRTPQHIIDKLCESANKDKTSGYSSSMGIYKLRLAICNWYKRKYHIDLDPHSEAVATMGSKEAFVNLARAVVNQGDLAIVPTPAYPIHTQAFIIAGANVAKMSLKYNEKFELDEDAFFENLDKTLYESIVRPKFMVVNFPHNPTTTTCQKSFYERLIAVAKKERFYIISDIAYADLSYDSYKAPSILQIEGAKDVAVETYTLSKSYNMAGWRVGFMVGNKRLIAALKKIKSWFDYGMYTPIQVGAIVALDGDQDCVEHIRTTYSKRMHTLLESFENAGWTLHKPRATMFVWARLPENKIHLGSLEFSKQLLQRAQIAVSPGIGFGEAGDEYVRIALIENENRIRQAGRNIKRYLKEV